MFFPRCMVLCPAHRMLLDDYLSPKTPGMTCLNFHDKTVSDISDCSWEEPELVSRWPFDISTSNRKEGALGRRDAKQNFSMKMRGGCQWMEEREESGLTYRACNWPPVFNSLSLFEFFLYTRLKTHVRQSHGDSGMCTGQPWVMIFRMTLKPYTGSYFFPNLITARAIIIHP